MMDVGRKCLAAVCALGLTLSFASQTSAKEQWEKCLDKVYNTARKVYDQEQKNNRKLCVKKQTGSQQACVDNEHEKAEKQEAKLEKLFLPGEKCDPVPVFGVNSSTGTNIGDAAQEAADNLARAIFGDAIDGLDGLGDPKKCQDKLIQRPGQAGTKQWKAMRKCAKDSHNDLAAIAACIASGLADAKAGDKFQKLQDDIQKHCIDKGGFSFPLPGTDNGDCAGATDAASMRTCIEQVTTCENCLAMEAMTGGDVDCATLSGDPTCGGYPPINLGAHKCTFAPGSTVQISTQALPLPPFAATGAIDIIAGTTTPDGKAAVDCELQAFDPILITGIGFICFTPSVGCPAGEVDCDGGNGLDVTMDSDHNVGACTSNPDCDAQCALACAPGTVFNAGCEGFCLGGANDGLPCTADSGCPGGSCPGKDGLPHGNVCGCDCLDVGGNPSAAGGVQCNLGVNINVEIGPPCDGADILIAVGTRCVPLTTETLASQLHTTNNTPAKDFPLLGPTTAVGVPADCPTLAGSVTTGIQMNGSVNFFDSTIGDLQTIESFTCQ